MNEDKNSGEDLIQEIIGIIKKEYERRRNEEWKQHNFES